MNSLPSSLTLLLCTGLLFATATLSSAQRTSCRRRLTTVQRCDSPPVVRRLDLSAYVGKWYQIYTSGSATTFSGPDCVTANYTDAREDPFRIAVLNCQVSNKSTVPECVTANATKISGGQYDSQLQVQFFPQFPPQSYSVAALLGNPNHGYAAAAVYGCDKFPPMFVPTDGFYIISRTPYAPTFILKRMIKKLRCNGYKNVRFADFIKTNNSKECAYFDGPQSYTVAPPIPQIFPPAQ